MSRGRLKLKPFSKKGMPLLNPTKAREKGYVEIKAYNNKVMSRGSEDTDFTK